MTRAWGCPVEAAGIGFHPGDWLAPVLTTSPDRQPDLPGLLAIETGDWAEEGEGRGGGIGSGGWRMAVVGGSQWLAGR